MRAAAPPAQDRGGVTVLMALGLLVVMGGMALGASRNVTRELGMGGDALQGRLASDAAETGVAWCLAWCQGEGRGVVLGPGQEVLLRAWGPVPWTGGWRQAFEVEARCLGPVPVLPGAGQGPPDSFWLITVRGRASPGTGAASGTVFHSARELLLVMPPPEAARRPRLCAWQVLR